MMTVRPVIPVAHGRPPPLFRWLVVGLGVIVGGAVLACSDPEPSCLSVSATVDGGHVQVDIARLEAEVNGVPFGRQKLERARESYEEARDAFSAHRGLVESCPQAWRGLGELALAIDELERDLDR